MERRPKVEERKCASFSQGIKDLIDAESRELAQGADDVDLLDIHSYPDVTVLLGDDDHGAGVRVGRVLIGVCGQISV